MDAHSSKADEQDHQIQKKQRVPAITGWMSTAPRAGAPAKVVTPPFAPKSPPAAESPLGGVPLKKPPGKEPRPEHQRKRLIALQQMQQKDQMRKLHRSAAAGSPKSPAASGAPPARARAKGSKRSSPPKTAPVVNGTRLSTQMPKAAAVVAPADGAKRLAPLPPMVQRDGTSRLPARQQPALVQSTPRFPPIVSETRSDSSVDGPPCSSWEDVPGMFVTSLEDEVLWGSDDYDFSDEEEAIAATAPSATLGSTREDGDDHFRGSVLPEVIKDPSPLVRGVLDAVRPEVGQQSQRLLHQQRLQQQQQQWSQGRSSSPSVVSRLQAASVKSLALGGGGAEGFVPGGRRQGQLISEGLVVGGGGAVDGGISNSPIASWTQEMAEDGAMALLAVLSDSHDGGISVGERGGGGGGVAVATRMAGARHAWPQQCGGQFLGAAAVGYLGDSVVLSPTPSHAAVVVEPRPWQPATVAVPPRMSPSSYAHVSRSSMDPLFGEARLGDDPEVPRRFVVNQSVSRARRIDRRRS